MSFPSEMITDASVWIDLQHGAVTRCIFDADATWIFPDVIAHEELEIQDDHDLLDGISQGKIQITTLTSEEVSLTAQLAQTYTRTSTPDLMALAVSMSRDTMLLTGDAALRKAGKERGVDVHGTLWVLDTFVSDNNLSKADAAQALQLMLSAGSYFPDNECHMRLKAWRSN